MPEPPDMDLCSVCGNQFPRGQVCEQCAALSSAPDLESIFRASQGLPPDGESAIRALASTHAMLKSAWTEAGFSDQEAFELVRVIVASSAGGIRCLNL